MEETGQGTGSGSGTGTGTGSGGCTPGCCLPTGSGIGDILVFDGFNWVTLPRPAVANDQVLHFGTTGPYWKNA